MTIEAFQIATGVLAVSTVGLGVIAYRLRKRLNDAGFHVRTLQHTLALTYDREEQLVRQNAELNGMVTKVQNQRLAALSKAAEKRKAKAAQAADVDAAARAKTISALASTRLRPRDEVVADIRASKAAQATSSGG